jgi:hypothetical protein
MKNSDFTPLNLEKSHKDLRMAILKRLAHQTNQWGQASIAYMMDGCDSPDGRSDRARLCSGQHYIQGVS